MNLQDRPESDLRFFRTRVRAWAKGNLREYPWRVTTDPYRLLVAEMMLRRTRADQVVPVYAAFISRFGDPSKLHRAQESEVATALRPLGLAWRVPAFRAMAERLTADFKGKVPVDRESLMSLPGVGPYVADAVRSFAFGLPSAIVDTNTVRVAGRYLGFAFDPESRRKAFVQAAVRSLVDPKEPKLSNLALLDFAALVCQSRTPRCPQCPVSSRCHWYRMGHELVAAEERPPYAGQNTGAPRRARISNTKTARAVLFRSGSRAVESPVMSKAPKNS